MVTTIKTSISLPKTLCNQAEILAQHLNISQDQLFELAIEHFIKNHQSQTSHEKPKHEQSQSSSQDVKRETPINQGDIYWVQLEDLSGSELGIRHPYVVIQEDILNHSRITTVIACALTSNRKRANTPGNVLLDVGEANLPKQSIVEVSKVSTLTKMQLGEYIGSLTEQRISQILTGMRFLQLAYFTR